MLVGRRELRDRHRFGELGLVLVCIAPRESVEGGAGREGVVHRVGAVACALYLGHGDDRRDQDLARLDFGGLHALDLDDVEAEGRFHDGGQFAGPEAERGLLEPFDHLAAPEPAELAPLRRRHTVGGKTAGDRREVRAAAQLSEQRVRELQGPRAGGGVGL